MDKDLLKDSRVTWISHRGNAHSFPENTAAAFDCAVADGFPVLETDLRPTSDGHIVLSHDRSLLRVAGVDRPVDLLTRAELEKIGLGEGHRLLFLDQFIDRYREKRWIFDLKAENAHVTIRNMKSLFQDEAIASLVLERTTVLCWTSGHQRMMRDELGFQSFYARKWQCFRAAMKIGRAHV